jgi:cyclopropane-fatty-acyl-phospholipid synthase
MSKSPPFSLHLPIYKTLQSQLGGLSMPIAVQLPQGQTLGPADAPVKLLLSAWSSLARLKTGQMGALAEEFVEGKLNLEGRMRDIMAIASGLLPGNPVHSDTGWWPNILSRARGLNLHTPQKDAAQVQFHYDVSDAFYALWLDPRRVYSCAYYRNEAMTLANAQEAKLDHICRKLMLQPGERFLDIGAGWGALLLWAAEHYGVNATGITLSKNQHAHVQRLIEEKGLQGRVRVELLDYRHLDERQPFDKISSVGMFEHVGHANLERYFGKVLRLLVPGGLALNHGITAGGVDNRQLGAGMGDFIEKYIFPGGELVHVSKLLEHMARSGLEAVDIENLRPHYARTLWDWSDALEAQLDTARHVLTADGGDERAEKTLRAYRLYLAGSAMSFEKGWIALHQVLATRPSDSSSASPSAYPFKRDYMYL